MQSKLNFQIILTVFIQLLWSNQMTYEWGPIHKWFLLMIRCSYVLIQTFQVGIVLGFFFLCSEMKNSFFKVEIHQWQASKNFKSISMNSFKNSFKAKPKLYCAVKSLTILPIFTLSLYDNCFWTTPDFLFINFSIRFDWTWIYLRLIFFYHGIF